MDEDKVVEVQPEEDGSYQLELWECPACFALCLPESRDLHMLAAHSSL